MMPAPQTIPETRGSLCTGCGKPGECSSAPLEEAGKHARQTADDSPPCLYDKKAEDVVNGNRIPRANWLARLGTIFPVGGTLHQPTEAARSYLLAETIGKRYPDLRIFIADFSDYLRDLPNNDAQAQYFLDVVFAALSQGLWTDVDEQLTQSLAEIVLQMDDAFYCLIAKVCATPIPLMLTILEKCLKLSEIQINKHKGADEDTEESLVDRPLIFGETPLIFSLRHKSPEVTLLLLRWGADTEASWINFSNPLEALLFSPNDVVLTSQQEESVIECARYFCTVLDTVDIDTLRLLEKEGYCPLIPNWEEIITAHARVSGCGARISAQSVPASLGQACRLTIRKSMKESGSLPIGPRQLPLPKLLQNYVDLTIQ